MTQITVLQEEGEPRKLKYLEIPPTLVSIIGYKGPEVANRSPGRGFCRYRQNSAKKPFFDICSLIKEKIRMELLFMPSYAE